MQQITMNTIQRELLVMFWKRKNAYDCQIHIGTMNNGSSTAVLHIYNWHGGKIIGHKEIGFFEWYSNEWQKNLDLCKAILMGEVDPFEEEK